MKDKIFSKSKFPWVLGCSALLIALCAAAFSVYGISTLFAGASISAMVMASSLEIGKLVATTFLYRYWSKCKITLKSYLMIAIVVLMAVTSLGIFGYLSSAYQKSSIEYSVTQEKIKSTEDSKNFYQDKIIASRKRIEDLSKIRSAQEGRMSEVVTNELIARNPLQLRQLQQQNVDLINGTDTNIKEENIKIQNSIDDIAKINDQVNKMKLGTAEKKDVQTFRFVADALHMTLDNVARLFILLIIFVFDPLAICLVLAYNVAVYKHEDESVFDTEDLKKKIEQIDLTKTVVLPETSLVKEEPKVIEIKSEEIKTTLPPEDKDKQDPYMDPFFRAYFKK